MYFLGLLSIFEEHLYQETHFFCVLLGESQFATRLLPPYLPFCVLSPKIPRSGPSRLPENMRRNALYAKKKLQILKENCLKSFLQKSGDTYFLVLTNRSKSNFKEKKQQVSMVRAMHFYLKPLPLKKDFLNQNAKAVSVTMIAKNGPKNQLLLYPFFGNLTLLVQKQGMG